MCLASMGSAQKADLKAGFAFKIGAVVERSVPMGT